MFLILSFFFFLVSIFSFFFFFNDTATTEIYTLSLHDALPICTARNVAHHCKGRTDDADGSGGKSIQSICQIHRITGSSNNKNNYRNVEEAKIDFHIFNERNGRARFEFRQSGIDIIRRKINNSADEQSHKNLSNKLIFFNQPSRFFLHYFEIIIKESNTTERHRDK